MGIRTGNLRVCAHPVLRGGGTLLGRKEGQHGGQRVHGDTLSFFKNQGFALDLEAFAFDVPANRCPAIQHRLDLQVIQPEPIF